MARMRSCCGCAWRWSKSSGLKSSRMSLSALGSGFRRKSSCQKPSDFSIASSSFSWISYIAYGNLQWAQTHLIEERLIKSYDFGLEGLRSRLLRQRGGLHYAAMPLNRRLASRFRGCFGCKSQTLRRERKAARDIVFLCRKR